MEGKPQNIHAKNIHANGLIYDGVGILIRGASSSGKSLLTLSLLQVASVLGKRAILVGDDRLDIYKQSHRLIMQVPDQIAGKIELAGRGIISCEYEKTSSVDLIIDMSKIYQRMPDKSRFFTNLLGVELPACPIPDLSVIGMEHQRLLALEAIKHQKTSLILC
ncbi:MAG: hypothetical protein L3J21_00055 [Devosiaceae bacterium]|nr:hypothetical protein [Devosiaceae bacterium]